ncbi:MAG: hypothetical protein F4X64_00215 [Chloroflexi bacterium]|nr:hypothetical protein [Chloroflexota bacterium]
MPDQESPAPAASPLVAPLLESNGRVEAIAILGPAGSFQRWPLASAIQLQGELTDAIAAAVNQRRIPAPPAAEGDEGDADVEGEAPPEAEGP